MELIKPTSTGDLPEAYQSRALAAPRVTRYVSLSFTRVQSDDRLQQEETYRLHTLDLATHRLVPYLLGVMEGGCSHDICSLMQLNALAAEYARDAGWSSNHAPEQALWLQGELGLEFP